MIKYICDNCGNESIVMFTKLLYINGKKPIPHHFCCGDCEKIFLNKRKLN